MESGEKTSVEELRDIARAAGWGTKDTIFENESYLRILLQANKMNLKKSKEVLNQIFTWRNKLGLDSVELEDFSPQFEYDFGFLTDGKTRSGAPCFYIHASLSRYARVFKKFGYEKSAQFLALKLKQVEKQMTDESNAGKINQSSCEVPLICDGDGFTLWDVPSFKQLWETLNASRELYNHFPIFASMVIIFINMNKSAEISLKVSKPFLEATGFRVVVHGTSQEKWSKYIDGLLGMEELCRFQATAQEYYRKSKEF